MIKCTVIQGKNTIYHCNVCVGVCSAYCVWYSLTKIIQYPSFNQIPFSPNTWELYWKNMQAGEWGNDKRTCSYEWASATPIQPSVLGVCSCWIGPITAHGILMLIIPFGSAPVSITQVKACSRVIARNSQNALQLTRLTDPPRARGLAPGSCRSCSCFNCLPWNQQPCTRKPGLWPSCHFLVPLACPHLNWEEDRR